MKKLLIGLLSVIAVATFATESYPSTIAEWNTQDITVIDGWIAKNSTPQLKSRHGQIVFLKALINKSSENITYEQFKTMAKQIVAEYKFKPQAVNAAEAILVSRTVYLVERFNSFKMNVVADPEYNTSGYVVRIYLNRDGLLDVESIRKINMEVGLKKYSDYTYFLSLIKFYEKNLDKFKAEDVKADMKKIKLAIYPKLDKNEKLKDIAVKVELILKAIQ